tara:strand:- start:176 stop:331 length:156 start_codon:yes stop_codon:yes gene_type:complete
MFNPAPPGSVYRTRSARLLTFFPPRHGAHFQLRHGARSRRPAKRPAEPAKK